MTEEIIPLGPSPLIRKGIFHIPDDGSYERLHGWCFDAWRYQPNTPRPWWALELRCDPDGTAVTRTDCHVWPGTWILRRAGDPDIWATMDSSSFDVLWQDDA